MYIELHRFCLIDMYACAASALNRFSNLGVNLEQPYIIMGYLTDRAVIIKKAFYTLVNKKGEDVSEQCQHGFQMKHLHPCQL